MQEDLYKYKRKRQEEAPDRPVSSHKKKKKEKPWLLQDRPTENHVWYQFFKREKWVTCGKYRTRFEALREFNRKRLHFWHKYYEYRLVHRGWHSKTLITRGSGEKETITT